MEENPGAGTLPGWLTGASGATATVTVEGSRDGTVRPTSNKNSTHDDFLSWARRQMDAVLMGKAQVTRRGEPHGLSSASPVGDDWFSELMSVMSPEPTGRARCFRAACRNCCYGEAGHVEGPHCG